MVFETGAVKCHPGYSGCLGPLGDCLANNFIGAFAKQLGESFVHKNDPAFAILAQEARGYAMNQ